VKLDDSPVVAAIDRLLAAGRTVRLGANDRIEVRPSGSVPPDISAVLGSHLEDARAVIGLMTCDGELDVRLDAFQKTLAAAGDNVVLPVMVLVPDTEVRRGQCHSCGVGITSVGRCWRCDVAMRLALSWPLLSRCAQTHTHTYTLTHTHGFVTVPDLGGVHGTREASARLGAGPAGAYQPQVSW
jgi:hypothetical protein